jgi:hypothetical protein
MSKPDFSSEELMLAEFNYISQTAFQAHEDRARVSSFYLIAVGSLVAALFSTQLFNQKFDPQFVALSFSGLFFVLTILGTLTTLQLARLRAAWVDSARAMNQIKDHWLKYARDKNLKKAFLWETASLPSKFKLNSVSFYQTLEVALISAMTFGSAVSFFLVGINLPTILFRWLITIVSGLLAFILQLVIYNRSLDE